MRLSNVEIRSVINHLDNTSTPSQSLVLHLDDGSRFNILLGIGRQVRFFNDWYFRLLEPKSQNSGDF